MPTLGELAERYEDLIRRKKEAAKQESDCNVEISEIEEQLLVAMGENGLQSVTTASGMNLHRKIDRFVSAADGVSKEQLIAVLANYDCTRDLVAPNYNSNSLRARLKEIEANGEELPEEIRRSIRITEKDKIGHRS